MSEYQISARVEQGGLAQGTANKSDINFDATSGRHEALPNPAELLLTAVAACILKNVQRYSEILHYPYRSAKIQVNGVRNDNPPFIKEISYKVFVDTDIEDKKIINWHKNILKFGTITNTVRKSVKLNGEFLKINTENNDLDIK